MHHCIRENVIIHLLVKWIWGGYNKVNTVRRSCSRLVRGKSARKLIWDHTKDVSVWSPKHCVQTNKA